MIPKVIHYCWFGGKPLPESAMKCINSWRKFFPEYEIKEWNESNYDVKKLPYTAEAYEAKKYAFVSDYARFDILYQQGGIYFDTDVEVIKPFNDILASGAFMGCEIDAPRINVNPGLGLGCVTADPICRAILNSYNGEHFVDANGSLNLRTIVDRTTVVLKSFGLQEIIGVQNVGNIKVFPKDYFNPLNDNTGKLTITDNTHSIHWYSKTWQTKRGILRGQITRVAHRMFGEDCFQILKRKKP